MSNPTTNDLESKKFGISSLGDVFVDIEQAVGDELTPVIGTTNDLENKKFTDTNKLRVVLVV